MEKKELKCCVSGCINYKGSQPACVTFHDFPNDFKEYKKWVEALGIPVSRIKKNYGGICSIHFKHTDLIKTSEGTFIKPGAIPNQNISYKHKKKECFVSLKKPSGALHVDCSGSPDDGAIIALSKNANTTMTSSKRSPIVIDDDSLLEPLEKTKSTPQVNFKTSKTPEKLVNVTFFDDNGSTEDFGNVSNTSFEAEETKLIPYEPPKTNKRFSALSNKLLQSHEIHDIDTSDDDWCAEKERYPKKKTKLKRIKKTATIFPRGQISKPVTINIMNHNSNSVKNFNPTCIAGCTNDAILFPLPRDYKVVNLWLNLLDKKNLATNLKAKEIQDGKYWICGHHFSPKMKDVTGTKLQPWAVPDVDTTKQVQMIFKQSSTATKTYEPKPVQTRPTASTLTTARNNSRLKSNIPNNNEFQSIIPILTSIPATVTIKQPISPPESSNKLKNFVLYNQQTISSDLFKDTLPDVSIVNSFQREVVRQLEVNNPPFLTPIDNVIDLPQHYVVKMVFLTVDKTDVDPAAALLKQMKALKEKQRVEDAMTTITLANPIDPTKKFSSLNSVDDSIKLKALDRNLKLKLIDQMPKVNGVPVFMQNNISINTQNNFDNPPQKPLTRNRQSQCNLLDNRNKMKQKDKQTATETTLKKDKCVATDDYDDDFEQYLIQEVIPAENADFRYIDDGQCVCNHCEKIFASSSHARRHAEQHKDKSRLCYKCGKLCEKHMAMFQHELKCDGSGLGRRGRVCTIRSLIYDAETELVFPSSPKTEDRTCNVCGKVSDCMIKHLDHMNKHTGNRPHKCTCGATFRSAPSFYAHRKRFGCSGKNSDFAPYGIKLGTRKTKEEKEQLQAEEKEKTRKRRSDPDKYFCKMCNVRCPNYVAFRAHRRKHNTERNHVCPECNNTYKDSVSLKQHIRQRHLKKSVCTVCNKKCTPHHLTIHMRTHTGEKPYSCVVCKESFISMAKLQTHKRSVHKIGEIKKPERKLFPCSICGKKFGFKKALQYHLERLEHLHKEREWKESIGLEFYTCEYCSVSYEYFGRYAEHVGRAHNAHCFYKMSEKLKQFEERLLPPEYVEEEVIPVNNGNLYTCYLCQKNFENQKALEGHLLDSDHLKEEAIWKEKYGYIVFTCETCGAAFDKFCKYAQHVKSLHQTEIYSQMESKFEDFQNYVNLIKQTDETIVEEIYYDGHYDNIIEENDIDSQHYEDIIEEEKVDDIDIKDYHDLTDVNMSDLENLQVNNETFQGVHDDQIKNDLTESIDNSAVGEMQGFDDYLNIKSDYRTRDEIDVVN